MSSSANPRSAPNNDRRTSATTSAKPRVASSRTGAKGRPGSSGEVQPDNSASNAPHRRKPSGAERPNGSRRTTTEKRTERVNVSTRENVQHRIRSPVKAPAGDDKGSWNSKDQRSPRPSSPRSQILPATKKTEKEPPCRLKVLINWHLG